VTAWATATPGLARLLASLFARANIEEIHCRGLGEHRLRNAVARGTAAILGALRRLQIGAKVPRAFDDLAADRQPLRLEAQKRRFHLIRVKGRGQRGRIGAEPRRPSEL
jgi:hypothetical protein